MKPVSGEEPVSNIGSVSLCGTFWHVFGTFFGSSVENCPPFQLFGKAYIAQSVERKALNLVVVGSSPTWSLLFSFSLSFSFVFALLFPFCFCLFLCFSPLSFSHFTSPTPFFMLNCAIAFTLGLSSVRHAVVSFSTIWMRLCVHVSIYFFLYMYIFRFKKVHVYIYGGMENI